AFLRGIKTKLIRGKKASGSDSGSGLTTWRFGLIRWFYAERNFYNFKAEQKRDIEAGQGLRPGQLGSPGYF
ncbi:unnamed protein product, partial [marine sediment metagenome]